MNTQSNKEIGSYLTSFETREEKYLAKVKELKLELPENLLNWRFWIGDPVIYINELKYFVEKKR